MLENYNSQQKSLATLYAELADAERGLRIMFRVGMAGIIVAVSCSGSGERPEVFIWLNVFAYLAIIVGLCGIFHVFHIVHLRQQIKRTLAFAFANISALLTQEYKRDI